MNQVSTSSLSELNDGSLLLTGTAEAEERDELIKENEADIRRLRLKREKKGRLEKIKREI